MVLYTALNMARTYHTAILMEDNRSLVTGGFQRDNPTEVTKTCEIISLKYIEPPQ